MVIDAMGIGEDAPAGDDEAAAAARELALALPWQAEVGLRVNTEDLQGKNQSR